MTNGRGLQRWSLVPGHRSLLGIGTWSLDSLPPLSHFRLDRTTWIWRSRRHAVRRGAPVVPEPVGWAPRGGWGVNRARGPVSYNAPMPVQARAEARAAPPAPDGSAADDRRLLDDYVAHGSHDAFAQV